MFTDAGAALLCPMLYQIDVKRFPFIIQDWRKYLRAGQANLVCGDQVDDFWHQKLGPEELYRRMMEAHTRLLPNGRTQGGFWHDISRAAVAGNLGPYSGVEWALAGGAAFSKIRESWRVYPLRAELHAPQSAGPQESFRMDLELESLGKTPVRHIQIQPFSGGQLQQSAPRTYDVAELKPGEKLSVPFTAAIASHDLTRGDRHMAAFRITWPEGNYGDPARKDLPRVIIVMAYVGCR